MFPGGNKPESIYLNRELEIFLFAYFCRNRDLQMSLAVNVHALTLNGVVVWMDFVSVSRIIYHRTIEGAAY